MKNRSFNPLLPIGFVVIAAAMALVGFFWLGDSKPVVKPLPAPSTVASNTTKSSSSAASTLPAATPEQPAETAPVETVPMAQPQAAATVSAEQRAREAADQKIGMLLAQNPTVEGARDKLLLLFPGFTSYEKIAAAPHINNLTGDDKIQTVVGFLKNPLTPPEAQETFFNDMLNRPPQVGWPVLIEVIATPNHPLAQRAKELLTTIVGEDHGNDVFGWQRGLRDQLKLQGVIQDDPPTANATPGTVQQ
jgi:hypothetical protein